MSPNTSSIRARSSWGRVWGVACGAALALALLSLAFVWPSAESEMDGLAVAVTGDADAVAGFTRGAEDGLGEVIDIVTVEDRADAVRGIEDRSYIGALVLGMEPEVLTAPAAGQVPAAFMSQMAGQLQATIDGQMFSGVTDGLRAALSGVAPGGPPSGAPGEAPTGPPAGAPSGPPPAALLEQIPDALPAVQITEVVSYSEGDPNGVGITSAGIPLTVGTLLASILIAFTVTGRWRRISAVLALGIGGGLILALILGTWLEVLPAPFGILWLALAMSLTATSSLFVGLHSALGRAGLGIAAVLTLFAAMPWAAFAVPYQFLPGGLGAMGQGMIPGATTTLTRSVSYFPDAATAGVWWALIIWAVIGLACFFVRPDRLAPSLRPQTPSTTSPTRSSEETHA